VPIEERKQTLAKLLHRSPAGITFNEYYDGDGTNLFRHACRFGCEGIVSKRLGSPYRSGRVDDWLKIKNPLAPAAKREADRGR
jgi:bifunctional non-homologous end joining protein LigD